MGPMLSAVRAKWLRVNQEHKQPALQSRERRRRRHQKQFPGWRSRTTCMESLLQTPKRRYGESRVVPASRSLLVIQFDMDIPPIPYGSRTTHEKNRLEAEIPEKRAERDAPDHKYIAFKIMQKMPLKHLVLKNGFIINISHRMFMSCQCFCPLERCTLNIFRKTTKKTIYYGELLYFIFPCTVRYCVL